jgi:hypothetical protein
VTIVANSSYALHKIVAPYGIICHGLLDEMMFFVFQRTEIELQVNTEGVSESNDILFHI